MIALFGALKQEVDSLLRSMEVDETVEGEGWRAYRGKVRGKQLLLVQTGMGRDRAERSASQTLERFQVAAVVSFGFAGALAPELAVGDTVLVRTHHSHGNGRSVGAVAADAGLLATTRSALESRGCRLVVGDGVTVDRIVATAEQKRKLAGATGAIAVDMESYWVGVVALTHALPFLSVRVVSDDLTQSLPAFGSLVDPGGRWMWRSGSVYLLSHPRELRALVNSTGQVLRASGRLTRSLRALVDAI